MSDGRDWVEALPSLQVHDICLAYESGYGHASTILSITSTATATKKERLPPWPSTSV